MAKLTVKQLYYGDEYGVMGQVIKSLLQNPAPTVTIDPNTYRELEIVRQTLIAVEKMKKNGCPADEDLMVWFGKLVAAEILEDALGNGKHDENN